MSASNICRNMKSSTSAFNTSKITTIFFDLDNTLIPTRKGDSKACGKLSEQLEKNYGFSMEEAENTTKSFLQAFRGCPDNVQSPLDTWRCYLWNQALPSKYKHMAEPINQHWLQLRYRYLAIPEEYENLLRSFRVSGYRLALITNGPSNAQWEKVQKLNVSQFFDCVLVSSDLPWEKPHPNIFLAACNCLSVQPSECLMIGDKLETDIQGARAAGLGGSVWIPLSAEKLRRYEEEADDDDEERPRPDVIVQNLCELYKAFPKLAPTSHPTRRNSSQPAASSRGYRRGFSLPDIDSCNSENSSDSVFG